MENKLPIKQLKDNLTFVIQNQIKNTRLLTAINKEFSSKGFEIEIPSMLFHGEVTVDALDEKEVLAISKATYEFLKSADINTEVNINPYDYFTDKILNEYELYEAPKEERNPVVIFDECRRIDSNNYWVYLTAEQLLDLRKNRNVQYFEGIQRMAKIVTLPNGLKIKKINVNKNGINKMKTRLKTKHDLRPTSISFTLLMVEGKDPVYKFTPEYKNTGELMIKTDFDRNSEHYAPLIIPDGYHRREAYADAFDEEGKKIKEGLGVHIYLMTIPEAKQYVSDVFERNETDEEYKESLNNEDNSSLFVDNIIENSNILRDNVVNTFKEYQELKNSLTYMKVLKESTKYTEINIKDEVTSEKEGRKIAKVIDAMINYMASTYFEDNIENMKNTFLLAPNTFVGYIAIANLLKDNGSFRGISGEIADKLVDIKENLFHKLKLDTKDCDVEKIYRYFENIAKEVI